jgi:hypothetical protein
MKHVLVPLLAAAWVSTAAGAAPPPAPATAAASAAASAPSGNETLEVLHQRLSERLGSVRQPTSDGSLVLRVPSRPLNASAPARKAARKPAQPVEHIEPSAPRWSCA